MAASGGLAATAKDTNPVLAQGSARRRPFTLTVGGPALNEELDFYIDELFAFNYSNQGIYLPDLDSYIPAKTYGALIAMPLVRFARAQFKNPPNVLPNAAIPGQIARLTFFEGTA